MTFAERLDELKKAATPRPWEVRDCSNGGKLLVRGDEIRKSNQLMPDADPLFIAFLANNADAILELVRAADEYLVTQNKYAKALLSAEVAVENYGDPSVELRWQAVAMSNVSLAEKRLQAALAKLNGEQT